MESLGISEGMKTTVPSLMVSHGTSEVAGIDDGGAAFCRQLSDRCEEDGEDCRLLFGGEDERQLPIIYGEEDGCDLPSFALAFTSEGGMYFPAGFGAGVFEEVPSIWASEVIVEAGVLHARGVGVEVSFLLRRSFLPLLAGGV